MESQTFPPSLSPSSIERAGRTVPRRRGGQVPVCRARREGEGGRRYSPALPENIAAAVDQVCHLAGLRALLHALHLRDGPAREFCLPGGGGGGVDSVSALCVCVLLAALSVGVPR